MTFRRTVLHFETKFECVPMNMPFIVMSDPKLEAVEADPSDDGGHWPAVTEDLLRKTHEIFQHSSEDGLDVARRDEGTASPVCELLCADCP